MNGHVTKYRRVLGRNIGNGDGNVFSFDANVRTDLHVAGQRVTA